MIKEKHLNEKLPNELSAVFSELQVSNYLCQAFFHFSPVHNLLRVYFEKLCSKYTRRVS